MDTGKAFKAEAHLLLLLWGPLGREWSESGWKVSLCEPSMEGAEKGQKLELLGESLSTVPGP